MTPKSLLPYFNEALNDSNGGSEQTRLKCLERSRTNVEDSDRAGTTAPKKTGTFLLESSKPLFDYQSDIVSSLFDWVTRSENSAALMSLPTGGGKTRTGLWFFRHCLEQKTSINSLLWVAPSVELVHQAADTLCALWETFASPIKVNVCIGDMQPQHPRLPTVSFLSAQGASKRSRAIAANRFSLMIFDEAHQCSARTFRSLVKAQTASGGRVLGLSATPGRSISEEGEDLLSIFDGNLIISKELGRAPVPYLREAGVLSELSINLLPLPPAWDSTRVRSLESKSMPLEKLASNPARFWALVDKINSFRLDSKVLVFCASIAHCHALSSAINPQIPSATVSHKLPGQLRSNILKSFENGTTRVLFNVSLLATGYDCPAITDVVLASPVRSPVLWEQIIGRVSRGPKVGGTIIGYVWELDDHAAMHQQVMSYARFLGDLWNA